MPKGRRKQAKQLDQTEAKAYRHSDLIKGQYEKFYY